MTQFHLHCFVSLLLYTGVHGFVPSASALLHSGAAAIKPQTNDALTKLHAVSVAKRTTDEVPVATIKQRLLQLAAQTDRGKLQDSLIATQPNGEGLYQAERALALELIGQLSQSQRRASRATGTPATQAQAQKKQAGVALPDLTSFFRKQPVASTTTSSAKSRLSSVALTSANGARSGAGAGAQASLSVDASLLEGPWELVYSTAQLFRSSPFFLAVASAYNDTSKSELFFKLHELQTCSWGVSEIGRVAQYIDLQNNTLVSEFDTILLPLTAIPIIGFWKLFPTFGGRIITVADKVQVVTGSDGDLRLEMELASTSFKRVLNLGSLPLVGSWFEGKEFPTRRVWERLPWNGGRAPKCSLRVVYVDDDMRVMQDENGAFVVYARPLLQQP